MIGRLRRRFILICAVSIFAVVALIFALIASLSISSMNRTLDTLTDSISEGNGRFPDSFDNFFPKPPFFSDDPDMGFITPETRYATRYFTVWLDSEGSAVYSDTDFIHSVTDDLAKDYAQKVAGLDAERGWLANYRYKIYSTDDGSAVVFVDGTMNRSSLLQSLVISGFVLVLAALVILFLIILLSGRAMKPIAESYEKQKQFITDANHELKTPLTLILTNLDIAESELGQNEWLDDIRSEGNRMTELVNQLVALSRMDEEKHPLNTSHIPLGKVVAETVSEFEALAKGRGKTLSSDICTDVTFCGDEVLIQRLVGVLMDNAVKYCDNNGQISVSLHQQRRQIILNVENTYAAVGEIELHRLFDRFYRADKARTFTGGYGIGLSMAKSIVERHKGEISAYRKDDNHIGFRVVLKNI